MMEKGPAGCIAAFGATDGWDIAVVVPAKDEANRITGCLNALAASAARVHGQRIGIVVVVNNSSDETAARACDWARHERRDLAVVVIDHNFPPESSGVGYARRLGIDLALYTMPQNGVILCTDADTHVTGTWIADNLFELNGADVVCGRIDTIPEDEQDLPPEIAQHGSAETDYFTAALEFATLLDPLAHDPRPSHHNGGGASLAFRKSVYQAVGGMPPLQISEDRAFVERAEAHDYRIRYSDRPVVRTSCRMTGRTEGELAGALHDRRDLPDAPSDQWLEPANTFYLRHALRGALRQVWPVPAAVGQVLHRFLGPEAAALREGPEPLFFGQFFQQIEARAQSLARVRMSESDCRRELPILQQLLAERLADPKFDPHIASSRVIDAVAVRA